MHVILIVLCFNFLHVYVHTAVVMTKLLDLALIIIIPLTECSVLAKESPAFYRSLMSRVMCEMSLDIVSKVKAEDIFSLGMTFMILQVCLGHKCHLNIRNLLLIICISSNQFICKLVY